MRRRRRTPPVSVVYDVYRWCDGDRIDTVAERLCGSSGSWHLVMDANPSLLLGLNVEPGTLLRVPRPR